MSEKPALRMSDSVIWWNPEAETLILTHFPVASTEWAA